MTHMPVLPHGSPRMRTTTHPTSGGKRKNQVAHKKPLNSNGPPSCFVMTMLVKPAIMWWWWWCAKCVVNTYTHLLLPVS